MKAGFWKEIWIVWGVILTVSLQAVLCQVQSFREAPVDTSVNKDETVELKCEVQNIAGLLQWTKDGFALGTDRSVPGFPRYSIIGSASLGQYNLLIKNATLADDARFQCQVGPAEGHPSLMATAQLSVNIPPEAPIIDGYTNGSEVSVPHQQENLSLSCLANNGKPAAIIKWYRAGTEITTAENIVTTSEILNNKLENSKSILTIKPQQEDNGVFYRCEAENAALRRPLKTMVMLSVLHPPEKPEITGYNPGQVVNMGDTLELMCVARGGNPLAKVYWYKNNEELDFSYSTKGNRAENLLVFTVEPNDNEAIYRCDVSNRVTPTPISTQVKLIVQFAPSKVTITGHENAKAGETITLKCVTDISNPAADISWIKTGRSVPAKETKQEPSPKGGFITTSWVEVTLTDQDDEVFYQCIASNSAFTKTAEASEELKVMYPPGQPTIVLSDNNAGRTMTAKEVLNMRCDSIGGNPLATLTWWKGDKELQAPSITTGKIVKSQLSIILAPDDNLAVYRCNATNAATVDPLIADVTLNVHFPPNSLSITTSPKKVKVGQKLTITCKSSTSNPASQLSWWKDNEQVTVGALPSRVVNAEHGGKSTIAKLELMPSAADHEEIYACRATNELIEEAVSDAVTLNVNYPPVFPAATPNTVDVIVDGFVLINVTAIANPSTVTYEWYRNGKKLKFGTLTRSRRDIEMPHFLQDGALLNVTNVTRQDSGDYVVTATNSEGAGSHTININVQYGATITELSNQMVDAGFNASLVCKVDANPAPDTLITWVRPGYNLSRAVTTYAAGVSTLSLYNAQREDTGKFECKANNGIGEEVTQTVEFVVKFAAVIDKLKLYSKVGADKGTTAKLTCVAEGAPNVEFSWFKGEVLLDVAGIKYDALPDKTSLVRHMSFLSIHNTTKADYGLYKCVAKNELGQDETTVNLVATSIPELPTDLKFINATHNSITISWTPGFNGGLEQTFRVKYMEIVDNDAEPNTKYEDVQPPYATVYTIKGLKLSTEYEMTVKASNSLGDSAFQPDTIRTRTSAAAPIIASVPDDVPLIIILTVSIIGMLLLGLNVLLILFFIRRRRRRLKNSASEATSQANSVEMYTAPTITDDSKSHRSMEDYPYDAYRPYDDDEDLKRFLPPPYPHPHEAYYPAAKPNYYAPPPSSDYDPNYGGGNRNPIYLEDNMGRSWADTQQNPYGGSVSLPPPPPEEELYADQLRRSQIILAPQKPPSSHGRLPPPPPARSTSNYDDHEPPVPTRNYAPDDIPYYGTNQVHYGNTPTRSPPPPPTPDGDPTTRGHLV